MCQVVVVASSPPSSWFLLLLLHLHPLVILCLVVVVVVAHCDWLPRPVFVLTFRPASNPSDIFIPPQPLPPPWPPSCDPFARPQASYTRFICTQAAAGQADLSCGCGRRGMKEEGRHWPCSCGENVVDQRNQINWMRIMLLNRLTIVYKPKQYVESDYRLLVDYNSKQVCR